MLVNSKSPVVAVIDIGSNTIKLLVAGNGNPLHVIAEESSYTRIIKGVDSINPRLPEENIEESCHSIKSLVQHAYKYSPQRIVVAATSAVRDADNGDILSRGVFKSTGYKLQVLSGVEEALAISRGVALDPGLAGIKRYYLIDLGGGSLELIDYSFDSINQLASLPLGAVRLKDDILKNVNTVLDEEAVKTIQQSVIEVIHSSGFKFLQIGQPLVVTSGSLRVAKNLISRQSPEIPSDSTEIPSGRFENYIITYQSSAFQSAWPCLV